jgi:hypothetical protein
MAEKNKELANPAGKQELLALVSRFQTQIKQSAFDEAQESLAAVRALVDAAEIAGGEQSSSASDRAATDRAVHEAKRLMGELNGLASDIKEATAAKPATKGELVKFMTQFQAYLGNVTGANSAVGDDWWNKQAKVMKPKLAKFRTDMIQKIEAIKTKYHF